MPTLFISGTLGARIGIAFRRPTLLIDDFPSLLDATRPGAGDVLVPGQSQQ